MSQNGQDSRQDRRIQAEKRATRDLGGEAAGKVPLRAPVYDVQRDQVDRPPDTLPRTQSAA